MNQVSEESQAPTAGHSDVGNDLAMQLAREGGTDPKCSIQTAEGQRLFKIWKNQEHLGGSVGWVSNFGSGHDVVVRGFKPLVGLSADSSEPGACFRFCVSLSLTLPRSCCVSFCLKNK